jgi:hypothetical protein
VFQLAEALGVDCSAFKVCVDQPEPAKPPAKKRGKGK